MEYNKRIADFCVGDDVEGFYILNDPENKLDSRGKPFMSGRLSDRSGMIPIKIWDFEGPFRQEDSGCIVKIRGRVTEFKGSLQLTVSRIRERTRDDQVDLSGLVSVAPLDPEAAMAEIRDLFASMEDPDYRAVCEALLREHEETFPVIPAAKSVHHSFVSGLLMHTLYMLRTADFLAGLYRETVDRDLLITGVFAHDLEKETEFDISPLGLVQGYSTPGRLIGHLVLGAQRVAEVCARLGTPAEKSMLLQHMVLSHHGSPEFGAAVEPMIPEAELLSSIDLIDSRMEIYRQQLADVPAGGFSSQIFALGRHIYRQKGDEDHGTD